jgi:hypothetical protein
MVSRQPWLRLERKRQTHKRRDSRDKDWRDGEESGREIEREQSEWVLYV